MFEAEIKARISDPDEMRILFEKMSGVYKISLIHEDTYFNMPKGLRDFRQTDEALRIRKSIEFKKNDKSFKRMTKYFITYKGKKLDSETKTRKELEIKLSNGESMEELLTNLGFQKFFTFKKERELYKFSYNEYQIEALIDYIPILKEYFIEVEYMIESAEKLNNARNILFNFLKLFDIKKEQSITKSYLELIVDRFKSKFKD